MNLDQFMDTVAKLSLIVKLKTLKLTFVWAAIAKCLGPIISLISFIPVLYEIPSIANITEIMPNQSLGLRIWFPFSLIDFYRLLPLVYIKWSTYTFFKMFHSPLVFRLLQRRTT